MFIDTSGFLALLDADEPRNERARSAFSAAQRRMTHSYVLAELVPLATSRRVPRVEMLEFISRVISSGEVTVAWISKAEHLAAHRLLGERANKTYSLCDAVSFNLMRDFAVTDALTTDHHFAQEGFNGLLYS